ncbi:MAG: hypothetical protein A2Z29_00555 [Chloroflexi bacterium RBG_16_56_11]|nr:MAG: hypothetical protein A2Z29_00555 [Chloroflexi bacterium RBG_16_56_11]
MNLAEMRAAVRRDLHDEDENNYRWSDDELERHIQHAARDFSEHVPCEKKTTVATASGSREIDISTITDRVMVEAVEHPVDKFPGRYQPFSLWGDTLTLLGDEVPDGSDASVYYGQLHTIDAGGSTINARHEDLVITGAGGYAAVEWALYAVNRVNTGGTKTPGDFLGWGNEKLKYFRQELRRLGRRNRIRSSSLYVPYFPAVSRTADFGP